MLQCRCFFVCYDGIVEEFFKYVELNLGLSLDSRLAVEFLTSSCLSNLESKGSHKMEALAHRIRTKY